MDTGGNPSQDRGKSQPGKGRIPTRTAEQEPHLTGISSGKERGTEGKNEMLVKEEGGGTKPLF